jgi:hypothetical protein
MINASSIVFTVGSLLFVTDDAPLFGTSPSNVGWFDLVIGYRRVTSEGTECLSSLEGPFLHIGDLSIPDPDSHSLEFCVRDSGFERCFDDKLGRIKSLIVRGGRLGNYTLPGWVDGNGGAFVAPDGNRHFVADLNDSFVPVVEFVLFPTSEFARSRMRDASTYMRASDFIDPSPAGAMETHDWRAVSLFHLTLPFESNPPMPSLDAAEGSTFSHSKSLAPSKRLGLSSFIWTAVDRTSELAVVTDHIPLSEWPERTGNDHDARKTVEFEESHSGSTSRDWSESCRFSNQTTAFIVTEKFAISNILERTEDNHDAPQTAGLEESHPGGISRGSSESCRFSNRTTASLVGTCAIPVSNLLQRTEDDYDKPKTVEVKESHAGGVSRDWRESCQFPNQATAFIVTDNIPVSNLLQRTDHLNKPDKSLAFERSHAGGILTGLSDSCQFPDQTGSLIGTHNMSVSKLVQGTESRTVKSEPFEKSRVEGVWTGLAESFPGPEQTGSLFGTCGIPVSKPLRNTDNNDMLDSTAFAKSRVQWISMDFCESFICHGQTRLFITTNAWAGSNLIADPLTVQGNSHFRSGDWALGSTAIWIGTGTSLAAILIVITAVFLLLACRRQPVWWATDVTESEMGMNIPADGELSSAAIDPFLSEENALSADHTVPVQLAVNRSE